MRNFRIHCLFTVIHCSFWRVKIVKSLNPGRTGGWENRPLFAALLRKNSLLNSLINSLFRGQQ